MSADQRTLAKPAAEIAMRYGKPQPDGHFPLTIQSAARGRHTGAVNLAVPNHYPAVVSLRKRPTSRAPQQYMILSDRIAGQNNFSLDVET
jgi:hypothetical protein